MSGRSSEPPLQPRKSSTQRIAELEASLQAAEEENEQLRTERDRARNKAIEQAQQAQLRIVELEQQLEFITTDYENLQEKRKETAAPTLKRREKKKDPPKKRRKTTNSTSRHWLETQTPTPLTDENEIQDLYTNDESNESENSRKQPPDNVKTKKAKKEKKDSPNYTSGDVSSSTLMKI